MIYALGVIQEWVNRVSPRKQLRHLGGFNGVITLGLSIFLVDAAHQKKECTIIYDHLGDTDSLPFDHARIHTNMSILGLIRIQDGSLPTQQDTKYFNACVCGEVFTPVDRAIESTSPK